MLSLFTTSLATLVAFLAHYQMTASLKDIFLVFIAFHPASHHLK
jgi:hypothetical protein